MLYIDDVMVRKGLQMFSGGRDSKYAWGAKWLPWESDDIVCRADEKNVKMFHNFGSLPVFPWNFKHRTLWNSRKVFWLSEILFPFGAQDADIETQMTVSCNYFHIPVMLPRGKIQTFEPNYNQRWHIRVTYQIWIETAVLAASAYCIAKSEKMNANNFNKENYMHHILGQIGWNLCPETQQWTLLFIIRCWRLSGFRGFTTMLGYMLLFRLKCPSYCLGMIKWSTSAQLWFGANWLSPHLAREVVLGRPPFRCVNYDLVTWGDCYDLWGNYDFNNVA